MKLIKAGNLMKDIDYTIGYNGLLELLDSIKGGESNGK